MALYKADIDSAYRRVPILPEHRRFARIMFSVEGQVMVSTHITMMFGSVASVHAWHRVASLLRSVARRILHLPLLCFVDDYFSVDRHTCAQAAMQYFARLVRACLGESAVAPRKLEWGNPLIVLGVEIEVGIRNP